MKALHSIKFSSALLVAAVLLIGCSQKDGASKEVAHGKDDGHGHGEESPSGTSFKAGKGVSLTEETRKILGLETADVAERKLPNQIRFTVQVFGEKHHHLLNPEVHSGCDVHGSAFLSSESAAVVKAGQSVQLLKDTNSPLTGVVIALQKALALGESEVVVGISNATMALKSGEFVPARIPEARQRDERKRQHLGDGEQVAGPGDRKSVV